MIHCMVDIETLGTGRDAAIKSIGATIFKPEHGWIADPAIDGAHTQFYQVVDLEHSDNPGVIDPATVAWWMTQNQEARDSLFSKEVQQAARPLEYVLSDFLQWFRESGAKTFWSNGPMFDERIIREACERNGFDDKTAISFRASRCFRTIKDLAEATGADLRKAHTALKASNPQLLKHKALDDAIAQAMGVCEFYKILGLRKD